MEDILYFVLVAAVMVGGLISSANKKKKEREAAARKAAQNASGENPEPQRKFVRKSLGEVLEELENQHKQALEPQAAEAPEDYYASEMASREENARAVERLRAMTYVSAENTPRRRVQQDPIVMQEGQRPDSDSQNGLKDILGGEFDLRRAVVETEILKPKFEQY